MYQKDTIHTTQTLTRTRIKKMHLIHQIYIPTDFSGEMGVLR